ncbi:MAG: hypothetical protein ACRELB_22570, partial [Polyangiaceae bacterium]
MDPSLPMIGKGAEAIYVESDSRRQIVEEIARPLELAPGRRLLAVGCTGSGKTTLVRRCIRRIRDNVKETGDYGAYVDVARHHRLDAEQLEGVLVAVAGEHLAARIRGTNKSITESAPFLGAEEAIKRHARGYGEWVEPEYDSRYEQDEQDEWPEDEGTVWSYHKGVISPPQDVLRVGRFAKLVEPLTTLRELAAGPRSHAILA